MSPVSHARNVGPPLGPGLIITPVRWHLQSPVESERCGTIVVHIEEVHVSHILEGIIPAAGNNDKDPALEPDRGCAGVAPGFAELEAELHPGRGGGCQVNELDVVKKSFIIVVTWIKLS